MLALFGENIEKTQVNTGQKHWERLFVKEDSFASVANTLTHLHWWCLSSLSVCLRHLRARIILSAEDSRHKNCSPSWSSRPPNSAFSSLFLIPFLAPRNKF